MQMVFGDCNSLFRSVCVAVGEARTALEDCLETSACLEHDNLGGGLRYSSGGAHNTTILQAPLISSTLPSPIEGADIAGKRLCGLGPVYLSRHIQ